MTGRNGVPEIRLVELTKDFRDVRAVDGVSLEVEAGEFFSLLGPSGCGKTTTLRMIGGFETPTAGRIQLRDRDVTDQPPDKRPVNMVFQNYALFPHLDVFENVAFGLRRRGVDRREVTERVGAALDLVRLAGYQHRRSNQLSGGQQQRVALARALVNRPNVLLLDEPLGALDLKLRRQLQVELKRIQTEVGITFVYVTHDQEEALTMSDRIAVMHRGRVEQLGTPEELYDRPATRFVADFIGTTNLLSGRVEGVDGTTVRIRLASGESCLAEAAASGPALAAGGSVELSLRPEAVELRATNGHAGPHGAGPPGAGPAGPGRLTGTVEQAAYLGAAVSYQVLTSGGLRLTALSADRATRLPVGCAVEVAWSPGEARVLVADGEPEQEERGP